MKRNIILLSCVFALLLALAGSTNVADAAPAHSGGVWHCVRYGETLFSIGRWYGVSPWAIASANSLADPDKIYAGQCLYIPSGPCWGCGACCPTCCPPSGRVHLIQPGETLYGISRKYGVSPWAIAAANGIYNLNCIYAGQTLRIP